MNPVFDKVYAPPRFTAVLPLSEAASYSGIDCGFLLSQGGVGC
jgi:hypothetical protein